MALKLSISGGPGSRTLAAGTLSIGRGESNDWVLPDPDRHLSKTHCVVSAENGRYVLTDLSTNGVYINGARQPTQRDSRVVLTDGDEFRLGEYSVLVQEVSAPASARPALSDDNPLDVDPLDDPLGAPVGRGGEAFSHPIRHAAPAQNRPDPFDEADHAAHRSDVQWRNEGFGPAVIPGAHLGPAQADNVDAHHQAMPAMRVLAPSNPNEIDFDALIGDLSDLHPHAPASSQHYSPPQQSPPPAPPPPRAAAAPAPLADPFAEFDDPPPRAPAPTAPPPIVAAVTEAPPAAPPPARPPPAPAVAAPPAPASAAPDGLQAAMRAFLEGAGVPGAPAAADAEAAMRAYGQVFRAMTEGLREVVMARTAIKGEMRIEQTMIRSTNNNPLKFSMTPDDAVLAMLSAGRPGYMPALTATKEAVDDIKTHELAVMVGVRSALEGLLRRFNPDALESRLTQGMLSSVLPAARKARLWDSFRDTYKSIASEAEDDFQAVFGREFAKAYTAQARKE